MVILITYLRKFACIAATGAIMMYGSEILFWSVPPVGLSALDLGVTWLAYTLSAYGFLVALAYFKVSNWRGLFLCGAIYGWVVEGVIAGQMYLAFPVQLVWTPLAWHGLIVALGIFWLPRISLSWRLGKQIWLYCALGLGFGLWAMWWPLERQPMPGFSEIIAYLVGLSLVPIAAQLVIDRWGTSLLAVSKRESIAVGSLLSILWLIRAGLTLQLTVLAFPVLAGLTLWALRHQPQGVILIQRWVEVPANPARHFLFLIVPVMACMLAFAAWSLSLVPPTNMAIYAVTTGISALIYLDCLRRALKTSRS
jgi:hypothetical protein